MFEGAKLAHPDGLLPVAVPLTLVCGPPAAGKSTYAIGHKGAGDLIIDLDAIASRLARSALHAWDGRVLPDALRQRNAMLLTLSQDSPPWPAAWFVVCEPQARWRDFWRRALKPIAVVVLETPDWLCHRRIAADSSRASRHAESSEAVMRWWNDYTPDRRDTIIRG